MNESDPTLKAKRIVEAALDRKAELPVVLDMRELTAYADTFIILSGRSDRQVRSIGAGRWTLGPDRLQRCDRSRLRSRDPGTV